MKRNRQVQSNNNSRTVLSHKKTASMVCGNCRVFDSEQLVLDLDPTNDASRLLFMKRDAFKKPGPNKSSKKSLRASNGVSTLLIASTPANNLAANRPPVIIHTHNSMPNKVQHSHSFSAFRQKPFQSQVFDKSSIFSTYSQSQSQGQSLRSQNQILPIPENIEYSKPFSNINQSSKYYQGQQNSQHSQHSQQQQHSQEHIIQSHYQYNINQSNQSSYNIQKPHPNQWQNFNAKMIQSTDYYAVQQPTQNLVRHSNQHTKQSNQQFQSKTTNVANEQFKKITGRNFAIHNTLIYSVNENNFKNKKHNLNLDLDLVLDDDMIKQAQLFSSQNLATKLEKKSSKAKVILEQDLKKSIELQKRFESPVLQIDKKHQNNPQFLQVRRRSIKKTTIQIQSQNQQQQQRQHLQQQQLRLTPTPTPTHLTGQHHQKTKKQTDRQQYKIGRYSAVLQNDKKFNAFKVKKTVSLRDNDEGSSEDQTSEVIYGCRDINDLRIMEDPVQQSMNESVFTPVQKKKN